MSVHRNIVANYAASAWTAVIGLAMLPVYLRFLGIESYGLVGFFVTLQAWLLLLDMGLTPTLNREIARFSAGQHTPQGIRDLFKSMEVVYACVAVLLAGVVAAGSGAIASGWLNLQALAPDTAARAIALMGLVIAAQWMGALYRSAVLGFQDQVWLSGLSAAMATARALATVAVLALWSPTITAFFVVQCGASLAETAVLAWRVRRQLPRTPQPARFSIPALRTVWRFAGGLAVTSLLATLLTQVDKLLLARLLPLDQFGYFALAVAVAAVLSSLIGPLHNVAYPRLSELVASGAHGRLAEEYHRFAQLLAIAVLPATLLLSVFAGEIVFLWTRDRGVSEAVAPLLAVWVWGSALNGLMHVPYAAQLAHGWARLSMAVNAVGVVVMVPAILFWVPREGAAAAAWIWVLLNVGYAVFGMGVMHRRILRAEKWKWYLQDNLWPLAAAAAAVLAAALAHRQLGDMSRAAELSFLLLAMALATLCAALATPTGRAVLRATLTRAQGWRVRG